MTEGFKDKAGSALLGELIVLLAQNEGIRRALSELPDADSDRILRDVVAGVQKLLHSIRPVSYGGRTPTPDQTPSSVPGPAMTGPQSPSIPAPAERPKTLQDLLSGSAGTISKAPGLGVTSTNGVEVPRPLPVPGTSGTEVVQPTGSVSVPSAPVTPRTDGLQAIWGTPVSKPPAPPGAVPPVSVPPAAAQRADISKPKESVSIPPAVVPPAAAQRANISKPKESVSIPPAVVPPAAAQRADISKPKESVSIPPAVVPPAAAQRADISKPEGSARVPPPAVRRKDTSSSAEAAKETSQPDVSVSGSMALPGPPRVEEKTEGIPEPAGGAPGMDTGIRRRGEEQRTPCTFEEELAYVHAVALIPFTESPSVDPFLLDESGLEDERQVMVVDLAGLRFYLSLIRADSPSVSKSGLLLLSKQDTLRLRYDHERVLNNLRLRGSLLPAEFGTVVHGRDGLLRRAELRHSALLELVVHLSSIERWELTVSVLDAKLARTLTGGAGTPRGSGREAGRSRGTRSGKGLDVQTLERLLNREKKLAQSILESIAAVAERHTVEFQISLGGGMSDDWKPILRAGFTVSQADMPRFHQAIVEVQNLHPLEEPMLHLAGTTESFSLSM